MIKLNLGINQLYLTISELNTINNPIYYIDITDETTKLTERATILDTSIYANRYNQFQLEVVNDINLQDLANGVIYLNSGKHTYSVITFDGVDLYEVCEVGIVKVVIEENLFIPTPYSNIMPLSTTFSSYSDRMLN